jgi:Fe-S-cluster-containing hydrogenase component 2
MRSEGRQLRVTRLASGKNPITFQMKATDSFLVSPGETFVAGGTTFEVLPDPLQSGVRTATCTAIDSVQLVRIKGEDFTKMLSDFPDVAASITEVARSRRQMDAEVMTRVQTLSLNDFLKQELLQGQNLLLMDLDKCTRCDECVDACIATHEDNVTRLVREGLRFDHYLVPTSCRACMDPLCMTPCPVGSITRKQTLDIVIEDWCIGCGRCATECPYGNINIVEVSAGVPSKKAEPRPKAVVCDLCVEYAEPNCVRACPHDAAIRVEPRKFFAEELAGIQLAVPAQLPIKSSQAPAESLATETRVFSSAMDLLPLLPSLKVMKADGTETVLQFKSTSTTFGRGEECDYVFADDQSLSRVHCTLIAEPHCFVVRDNNSTNGTYLNGFPVSEAELQDGDVLRMGNLEFIFRAGRVQ